MRRRRALWASTASGGGIATYVRGMQRSQLWTDWNVRQVVTHREGSTGTKLAVFAEGAYRFVGELLRYRPDVVHLHAASDTSLMRKGILLWIAWAVRVPVVIHIHGSRIENYYEKSGSAVRAAVRLTLTRSKAVVALGDEWEVRLRAIAPRARIVVIPNAVRLAARSAQPAYGEPVRVVFLGKVGDHKGTFNLLESWAKVACDPGFSSVSGVAAMLTIAGDGEVARARERVRDLCLEETVEISGWLAEHDVNQLLDHAQILVLPSRSECQPMSVLEAMARGLCVIASDVGGIPEMIGGGCGILVPPDDSEALAAALRVAVHDERSRTRYGVAAQGRIAERHEIGAIWRQLDALYREVSR